MTESRRELSHYNTSSEISVNNIHIANSLPIVQEKTSLLYDEVEKTDYDIDYDFQIQTGSYNPLVELANPLLAVALRANKLTNINIQAFYNRMKNEIIAVSEKVKMLNYDSAFQLSFRYCLCTFIDEMAMNTSWGKDSKWGERSLLSYFHNETWGGEKFYSILSRTMLEPERYQELLEFMYICLALGFQGQYALRDHGQENLQNMMIKLQKTLRAIRGYDYERDNSVHLYQKDYSVKQPIPTKYFLGGACMVLALIYFIYSMLLDSYSSEIIRNINSIL
ncbi:type VI secretion system protein ImpK [Cricetibacter osteomyelitidis]|uniref:Type VI secretion system protein ImpK n=1 Tax=Cricetibacter osteomyelitidis TaxID=1521931 RepID=A0A4R2SS65_9PAST|nr:type IVB secretion system protein IcmH/DotU [Cricetibacter osteomyelitidis]TCP91176.1 type VI secretion system protein ImpK [Cricetibacter osteomyelitidis]